MSRYKPYSNYKDSGVEWIEQVPKDWEIKPLFAIAVERDESNKGMIEENLLSLSYGTIVRKDINTNEGLLPESFETYQIVRPGDIIFRLTDLQNDHRSLRTAIANEIGIITSAYVAVKPIGIISSYLNFLLRAYDIQKVFYAMGGGMRQSMRFDDLRWLPILIPNIKEQEIICEKLECETVRIDALVEKKTRFIKLLREKRQALITRAVTKGLDPNVKMKDSSVKWFGQVPEHWDIKRLKFVCNNIKAGPFGSALTKDMYVQEGYRVYGQEQVIANDFAIGDYYINEDKFVELQQYEVKAGDILVSCVGTFGKIAVVPVTSEKGIINPRLIRMRTNNLVKSDYISAVMKSHVVFEQFSMWSRGGTMDVINIGTLSAIVLPLPPRIEQLEILAFINKETTSIDTLIRKTERSIELLKERRTAFVTAAVTGQIDLREVAQ